MQRKPNHEHHTRIIVDPRDATKDYYLPERTATKLYRSGKLDLIHAYNNRWDYCDPKRRYAPARRIMV